MNAVACYESAKSASWFRSLVCQGFIIFAGTSAAWADVQYSKPDIAQQHWQKREVGPVVFSRRIFDPAHLLALDLRGTGVRVIAPWQSNATFDWKANARKVPVGWVGREVGILVLDRNGNGIVDSAAEWFGESFSINGVTPSQKRNSFDALGSLAIAGAKVFSRQTAKVDPVTGKNYFDLVQIWIDANEDGATDPGELHSLDDCDVASIDLKPTVDGRQVNGNELAQRAEYTKRDGSRNSVVSVGIVDATGDHWQPATWQPSVSALIFTEYAFRGGMAKSKGQALGARAALAANPIDATGTISALKRGMATDRYFVSRGRQSATVKAQDPKLITMYRVEQPDKQVGNPSGILALSLVQDSTSFMTRVERLATVLASGADASLLAQKTAVVANVTGTAKARDAAERAAESAATSWAGAIVAYLDVRGASKLMNDRKDSLRISLDALVPVNRSATSHLPGGYTYFSPGDAILAADSFDGYAHVTKMLSNAGIARDALRGALATSAGYTSTYVGQAGRQDRVFGDFNLVLAGSGAQTITLSSSVDHVIVTPASDNVTLYGFQTGTAGDQLQFLGLGNRVSVESTTTGLRLVAADGKRYVNLENVSEHMFDLFSNLTGVSEISFSELTSPGTRSIEGARLYDAQVHIRKITASHFGDTLIGDSEATTLIGGRGDDNFVVTGRDYQIDGGPGENHVIYSKWQEGVTVNLRTGTDSLGSRLSRIQHIIGTDYRDTLIGDAQNNVFEGGKGYDTIEGGGGNDVYLFGRGDGVDTIINGIPANRGPSSVLRFGDGIGGNDLWLSRQGNHLVVGLVGSNDRVIVTDWFAHGFRKLGAIELSNGERLDVGAVERLVATLAKYRQLHADFDPRRADRLPDGVSVASSFSRNVRVPKVPRTLAAQGLNESAR